MWLWKKWLSWLTSQWVSLVHPLHSNGIQIPGDDGDASGQLFLALPPFLLVPSPCSDGGYDVVSGGEDGP